MTFLHGEAQKSSFGDYLDEKVPYLFSLFVIYLLIYLFVYLLTFPFLILSYLFAAVACHHIDLLLVPKLSEMHHPNGSLGKGKFS